MFIDILFRRKYSVLIVIFVLAIILLVVGLMNIHIPKKNGEIVDSETEAGWVIYTNTDYNFAISFPKDWKIHEDLEDELSPKINIYKPKFKVTLPMDQFSPETNVSIFPKGVQSEAVIGKTQIVDFGLADATDRSVDYLLANDQVWASFVNFRKPPTSWKNFGFVWLNTEVKNLKYSCLHNNVPVGLDECNTFGGDSFVRSGTINEDDRDTQLKILKSFTFVSEK